MRFEPDWAGVAAIRTEAARETVPRLTEAIFQDSQVYVPVLTGELRASGHTEYNEDQTVGRVVYGDGLPDARAVYQEVGTSRMDAQPYLRPATFRVREL